MNKYSLLKSLAIIFVSISIISLINTILTANFYNLIISKNNILKTTLKSEKSPKNKPLNYKYIPLFIQDSGYSIFNKRCSCDIFSELQLVSSYTKEDFITAIQNALIDLGYITDAADGILDVKTKTAIKNFQSDSGHNPTGIADSNLWLLLCNALEKKTNVTTKHLTYGNYSETISSTVNSNKIVLIDISDLILTLFENGKKIKSYNICVGSPSTPTPLGDYKIVEKKIWDGGFGSRWMGLNVAWGSYGIHGTNKPWSIGQRLSGGCIRMLNQDIIDLYSMVDVGTSVKIVAKGISDHGMGLPEIKPGEKGWHVLIVQKRLTELGYYNSSIDGAYGILSEKAVIQFQKDNNIPPNGIVGPLTYSALSLKYDD